MELQLKVVDSRGEGCFPAAQRNRRVNRHTGTVRFRLSRHTLPKKAQLFLKLFYREPKLSLQVSEKRKGTLLKSGGLPRQRPIIGPALQFHLLLNMRVNGGQPLFEMRAQGFHFLA